MKKIILIVSILITVKFSSNAQLFEEGNNVYAGLQTGFFAGNELYDNGGVIAPSFYRNFFSNQGVSIRQSFRFAPMLSAGYKLVSIISGKWEGGVHENFTGSESQIFTLQPMLIIHNRFQKTGIFNRLKLYGSIAPIMGWSKLNIVNNNFLINGSISYTGTLKSGNLIFGFETGTGVEFSMNNQWGLFFELSLQELFVDSPFFIDSNASYVAAGFGVKFNIAKQKRFNY